MKLSKGAIIAIVMGLITGTILGWPGGSMLASLHFLKGGESKNGWSYYLTFGRNEPPSLAAASNAKHGMFAHLPEEAVYYIGDGNCNNGQVYSLHFEADEFPQVEAFWSLTMYLDELPYNLVANPIDRFVISDRSPGIRFGEDGSLDIYIQHSEPTVAGRTNNWLPAPDGQFKVLLRTYITGEAIQNGSYAPPQLQLITN